MILYIADRNIRVDDADNQISYNSDYIAEFHFDDEWNGKVKTARFVQNGEHFDVLLVDDRCEIPPLKTGFVRIGVFSDSMTSTYADVYFKTSIKDGSGNPAEPPEDVYAQLTALIESGMLKGEDGLTPYVGENNNWWIGDVDTGILARGYTPVKGVDYFTTEEVQQIQNEVSEGAIGDFKSVVDSETNKYNTNATEKLTEYNGNATEKTEAYNSNAETKLDEYNQNADNRVAEFDAHTEQIQTDISGLKSGLSNKLPKSPSNWELWTAEEQAMARERIGLHGDFELVADIELSEETRVVSINFETYLQELYVVFSGTATSEGNAGIDVYFGDGTGRRYAPTCPDWMNTSKRYAIAHIRLNQGIIYSEATKPAPNSEWGPVILCTNLNGFMFLTETQNSIKGINMQSLNGFSWSAGCKFTVYGVRA